MNIIWCLIWSIEHGAWWKPNKRGYTLSRDCAGLYTLKEAIEIVDDANKYNKETPNEAIIIVNKLKTPNKFDGRESG